MAIKRMRVSCVVEETVQLCNYKGYITMNEIMNSGYVRSEKEACFNAFTQTNNLPKNVQT
jgi:hypothetical protein